MCELQGSSRFGEEKGRWEPPRIGGTPGSLYLKEIRNCIKNSSNELNLFVLPALIRSPKKIGPLTGSYVRERRSAKRGEEGKGQKKEEAVSSGQRSVLR